MMLHEVLRRFNVNTNFQAQMHTSKYIYAGNGDVPRMERIKIIIAYQYVKCF